MSDFTDMYKELVILQYYSKEKAQAEIKLWSDEFENVYSFLNQFFTEFDLDQATGDRLDKIGKIVGQSRIVEGGVTKNFFGYQGASNALAYGAGRYFVEGDDLYTDSELTDGQYRAFIKAKVSKNNASAIITGNGRDGLQDAIQLLFNGSGYVYDNQDMSLNLYIDDTFPTDDLILIIKANLLPKPQAVRYRWYVLFEPYDPFGNPVEINGLALNGINQYVRMPNINNAQLRNALTMCAWVKSEGLNGRSIICIGNDSSVMELVVKNEKLRFHTFRISDGWEELNASEVITDNYMHVAVTHDGVTAKLYYNGILKATGLVQPAKAEASCKFTVGIHHDLNNDAFLGCIDRPMVFDSVLSESDLLTIVNNGILKQPEDYPASITSNYYMALPLNNGVNNPEDDRSLNNLDGTLVNSPTYTGCVIVTNYLGSGAFGYAGAPNALGYGVGTYAQALTIP